MPSVSKKQHNLMEMVAHDPAAAKRTGIPQSVGRDYVAADRARASGEPDADDQTRKAPRHHGSHDMPTKTPPRQHGTHDAPMKPGKRPGC